MKRERLRVIWYGMRQRCYGKNPTKAKYYKDKGIQICEEWGDFSRFKAWALSHGYRDDLSIDRIDSCGNYEPSNCRWIPLSENSRRAVVDAYKRRSSESGKRRAEVIPDSIPDSVKARMNVLTALSKAFPQMTEFQRGRVLGSVEAFAGAARRRRTDEGTGSL